MRYTIKIDGHLLRGHVLDSRICPTFGEIQAVDGT